jgi:RHS repeat-associated protein
MVETRTAFLPQATQAFTYDEDGNITGDGVWTYEWDAENRLWAMQTTANAVMGGVPAQRLEFKYDHLHRRVEKLVWGGWNGTTFTTVTMQRRFLYDGWSMIAEFAVNGSTLTLTRSYTWGLDIARSLTDAGGVGALLQIRDHALSKDYLPSYDGNGNIDADSGSGTCVAAYEYSPYGEFLRSEGTYAKENPFRFSTKFTDDESGLVYYGRRYYSPANGSFINRDPVEEDGGRNIYAFALNDPTNKWDVLGLSTVLMDPYNVSAFSIPPIFLTPPSVANLDSVAQQMRMDAIQACYDDARVNYLNRRSRVESDYKRNIAYANRDITIAANYRQEEKLMRAAVAVIAVSAISAGAGALTARVLLHSRLKALAEANSQIASLTHLAQNPGLGTARLFSYASWDSAAAQVGHLSSVVSAWTPTLQIGGAAFSSSMLTLAMGDSFSFEDFATDVGAGYAENFFLPGTYADDVGQVAYEMYREVTAPQGLPEDLGAALQHAYDSSRMMMLQDNHKAAEDYHSAVQDCLKI